MLDYMVSVNYVKNIIKKLPNDDGIKIVRRLRKSSSADGESRWSWKGSLLKRRLTLPKEINQHMTIVGESGSGKSNACKALLMELASHNSNFAVLDPHEEYIGMAEAANAKVYNSAHNGINIFELDGLSAKEKTSELVLMFGRHFRLGQYQASVLYRCLRYLYGNAERWPEPSMGALASVIAIFKKRADAKEAGALQTIRDRLNTIYSSSVRDSISIASVMEGNSVFALSDLHTAESQAIFMEGFLRKIYSTMLERRKTYKKMFYIIVEEAAKLGESEALRRIVSEGRKYGVGVITLAQSPKDLERSVRVNSSVFISFYQREPEELNYVANFISGGNEGRRFIEVKKALRMLGRSYALVLAHSMKDPVMVRFPEVRVSGDSIEYRITEFARNVIGRGELLRRLYSRGFYYTAAIRSIDSLVLDGKLHKETVDGCGALDGTWYITKPKNSARHDIFVALISQRLAMKGVRNRIYDGPNGPDIVAGAWQEPAAFEYESGSKSRREVLEMLERRRKEYKSIVVVVNPNAIARYAPLEGVRLLSEQEFFS